MRRIGLVIGFLCISQMCFCWGFYAHKQINYYAVFLLPPAMLDLYKPEIGYLTEHAVDPDKRRYAVVEEAPRHYIDLDHYGDYPFESLPRTWDEAKGKFSEDSLNIHGIAPWWIDRMMARLTKAFEQKDRARILKYSADLGHYIADIHVPLHASSNHNGQLTGQHGIHGFWESRIPELFAASSFDFLIGRAEYIGNVSGFMWARVLESASAADSVLSIEKKLSGQTAPDRKYSFETRNGQVIRQYAAGYAGNYHRLLQGMVERRMRQAIYAVASCWFTAWVNAGQPELTGSWGIGADNVEVEKTDSLQLNWMRDRLKARSCDQELP